MLLSQKQVLVHEAGMLPMCGCLGDSTKLGGEVMNRLVTNDAM